MDKMCVFAKWAFRYSSCVFFLLLIGFATSCGYLAGSFPKSEDVATRALLFTFHAPFFHPLGYLWVIFVLLAPVVYLRVAPAERFGNDCPIALMVAAAGGFLSCIVMYLAGGHGIAG